MLGDNIKKFRKDFGISQDELAEKLGVTKQSIASWESNETQPSLDSIIAISKMFNVSTDMLLVENESVIADDTAKNKDKTDTSSALSNNKSVKRNKLSKKKLVVCILVIVLIAVGGFFSYRLLLPFSKNVSAIEKATASVVKVYCYDYYGAESATGSGFIAFDDQTVVTNYHVAEKAYSFKVSTEEDITYEVDSILAYSKEQDIAILKLNKPTGLNVLQFGSSQKIKKGETVTAIGSPLGIKNTVSQGVLSGRLMQEKMDALQFTAAISSGSSGGALFDEHGTVIGVTYATIINGQNINLAIPSEIVEDVYNRKGAAAYTADTVYTLEHSYVKYLKKYDKAIEVTFKELKTFPLRYAGKTIRIRGFAADAGKEIMYTLSCDPEIGIKNQDPQNRRASTIEAILGDFESHNYISMSSNSSPEFAETVDIGDEVMVIGEFRYLAKGEIITLGDGSKKKNMANYGAIVSHVILKVE